MSYANSIFQKVPVEIQNRSGADCTHQHFTTLTPGTLVPTMSEYLMPGDKISLGSTLDVQFAPMVTNFFGKVDICQEAFFVPLRLLWGGFKDWYTYKSTRTTQQAFSAFPKLPCAFPSISDPDLPSEAPSGSATLWDYLGHYSDIAFEEVSDVDFFFAELSIKNFFLPLAYYKIWDDWYRDSLLQKPCFEFDSFQGTYSDTVTLGEEDSYTAAFPSYVPFLTYNQLRQVDSIGSGFASDTNGVNGTRLFTNGIRFGQLMQRNWFKDYFTTATTLPQYGAEASLVFNVSGGSGEFTISALRAANALQKFVERNNLSAKYEDQIFNRFGVKPSDSTIDHPIYLGSTRNPVIGRSIMQTSVSPSGSSATNKNPFNEVGSYAGRSSSLSQDSLVDSFEATEPGIFMVLVSVVPHAIYNSGIRRNTLYNQITDFPDPLLAQIGDQAVFTRELGFAGDPSTIFGYQQRYAEHKFINDRVTGLLRDGENLEYFALQRDAFVEPELSSDFIEIGKDSLDGVLTTPVATSGFCAWADCMYTFKKSSVLPAYCIPTLGDSKDTHTVMTEKGGKRL